jgi:hypothetical protein
MAKSVDVVGWRGCAKQKELGPKRFVVTLKKIGRQAVNVQSLPPPSANEVGLTPEQRRRIQQNQDIRQGAAMFRAGTPECPTCPIADARPYGCWIGIDCPVDATAEKALFDYFTSQLGDDKSPAFGIYRDIVSKAPTSGTPWHTDRGATGDLAELEQPLVKEWGFLLWKKRVDSAQLLGTLFFVQKRLGLISAFTQFWEGFVEHTRATVQGFDSSTSLLQLEALAAFYGRAMEHASATDGVQILVESDGAPDKEG